MNFAIVIEVVPPNTWPKEYAYATSTRPEESYVVWCQKEIYWPRYAFMKKIFGKSWYKLGEKIQPILTAPFKGFVPSHNKAEAKAAREKERLEAKEEAKIREEEKWFSRQANLKNL